MSPGKRNNTEKQGLLTKPNCQEGKGTKRWCWGIRRMGFCSYRLCEAGKYIVRSCAEGGCLFFGAWKLLTHDWRRAKKSPFWLEKSKQKIELEGKMAQLNFFKILQGRTFFYLRRSRQVIERWVLLLLLLLLLLLGGGLLWGHDLRVDLEPKSTFFGRGHLFWSRSPSFFSSILFSHPKFPSGWDPSRSIRISQPLCSLTLNFLRGGIQGSLTRFLFGVGSVT